MDGALARKEDVLQTGRVIITNSAGAGMNNVVKDIGDSLRY